MADYRVSGGDGREKGSEMKTFESTDFKGFWFGFVFLKYSIKCD